MIFFSLITGYLANIPLFSRKSWIGVNSIVNLCKTFPWFNQRAYNWWRSHEAITFNCLRFLSILVMIHYICMYTLRDFNNWIQDKFHGVCCRKLSINICKMYHTVKQRHKGNISFFLKIPINLDFWTSIAMLLEINF